MEPTKTYSRSSNALSQAAKKAELSPNEFSILRTWLAEQLVSQEYARLEQGGHTQNQVPLRSVFVDLPVSESTNFEQHRSRRPLFLGGLLSSQALNIRRSLRPVPAGSHHHVDGEEKLGVEKFRGLGFSATLLIGGPGQGKSTLGQLACQLHRASLLMPLQGDLTVGQGDLISSFALAGDEGNPLALPSDPYVPLQILLPDLATWLARDSRELKEGALPLILQFLEALPSSQSVGLKADYLLAIAPHIPFLIVFDGFDEVGSTLDRERLVAAARQLLMEFAHVNASVQLLATTRPQGYAGELAGLGIPLKERYLAPLMREEAIAYAEKLVAAKIPDPDLRGKTLTRLREAAAESATQRLMTTPLQVTILTALVQQLGRAPRERWNLFSRYFSYTYDREIERQTYASRLLAEHRSHIEQIHARVALLLQVEAERAGGAAARMPRTRLEEVIEAVLLEDEVSKDIRTDLVRDIAVAAENRLVFLVEPEPGQFGFEIRSLQEFMAAWCLSSGRDSEIEARLFQVAKAPMFRNVALFVASKLFSEGSPLRDILAERICGLLDNDSTDDASRVTCAGALLALETLEEGAVLSQPKRARALMARGVRLLNLPPGNEHIRLVHISNDDTSMLLADAIVEVLRNKSHHDTPGYYGTWLCLVTACNLDYGWAKEIGNRFFFLRCMISVFYCLSLPIMKLNWVIGLQKK